MCALALLNFFFRACFFSSLGCVLEVFGQNAPSYHHQQPQQQQQPSTIDLSTISFQFFHFFLFRSVSMKNNNTAAYKKKSKEIAGRSYNYCGKNDGDDDDEKGKALKRTKLATSSHFFVAVYRTVVHSFVQSTDFNGNFYFHPIDWSTRWTTIEK